MTMSVKTSLKSHRKLLLAVVCGLLPQRLTLQQEDGQLFTRQFHEHAGFGCRGPPVLDALHRRLPFAGYAEMYQRN